LEQVLADAAAGRLQRLSLEPGAGGAPTYDRSHLRGTDAMRHFVGAGRARLRFAAISARSTPSTAPIGRSAIPKTSSPRCARCRGGGWCFSWTTISMAARRLRGADARAHPAQDALVLQITIDVAKDDALSI